LVLLLRLPLLLFLLLLLRLLPFLLLSMTNSEMRIVEATWAKSV